MSTVDLGQVTPTNISSPSLIDVKYTPYNSRVIQVLLTADSALTITNTLLPIVIQTNATQGIIPTSYIPLSNTDVGRIGVTVYRSSNNTNFTTELSMIVSTAGKISLQQILPSAQLLVNFDQITFLASPTFTIANI
jgi:hypothetical protein